MGSTEIRRDYGRRAVRSAVVVVIAVCLTEWCDSNKTLGQTNRETRRDPMTPIEDDARLPRVLLLGDSISIGYTLPVRDLLAGEANVHRPNENCGPTTRGVERIDAWLGDKPWDVIHVNFGLHDLKYCDDEGNLVAVGDGHVQVPPDAYQANLRQLLARLRATGARIIWTTTTPVPEGAKGRVVGDAAKYNTLALQVAYRELGQDLFVDDLYALAKEKQAELQQPANVHFTNDGSKVLAEQVSNAIRAALASRNATASATARGIVYEDVNSNQKFDDGDRPLPEVRVSNGEQIVKTDAEGRYVLPVTDDTILFVIKPRGYRSPVNELQLPQFYYVHKPNGSPGLQFPGVAPTGPLPESVDFPLYAQEEPEQFKALLFGDPQPRDQREVDYIAHDVVEELRGTDAAFGVTLGDIVFDDLSMFQPQARVIAVLGIPWFNVIGNHDINYDAHHDVHSDETFERHFGPSYYSFDHGPVHFLVLDDVEWLVDPNGKGDYQGGLGAKQVSFVKQDLALIPDDQLVVLMMHIPLDGVRDRTDLFRLIEKRPFCMSISAHTHYLEHRMITREDGWQGPEPHHHFVNVTVSGSWWSGLPDERGIPHTQMADGAPNGYSIISFDGQRYALQYRAAGRLADYQMNVYAPEVVASDKTGATTVRVNVFNGSEKSQVSMRVDDDGSWVPLPHTPMEDPEFRRMHDMEATLRQALTAQGKNPDTIWRAITAPKVSSHIWSGPLPDKLAPGTHTIQIRAVDMHGQEFHDSRVIRVE